MADIKEIANRWLARNTRARGVHACGLRYPDQTTFNQAATTSFKSDLLDNAWNGAAATFKFLKQHGSDVDQMCWVYENFLLHCATRGDEICLGIFTSKNEEEFDAAAINRMLSEFKTLRVPVGR